MLTEMTLEDDSIQNAAELLARNKNLHRLYLQNNQIAMEGAMALAQGLICNQNLKLLNLSYNKIGNKGAILICEALREHSGLRSLS